MKDHAPSFTPENLAEISTIGEIIGLALHTVGPDRQKMTDILAEAFAAHCVTQSIEPETAHAALTSAMLDFAFTGSPTAKDATHG